MTNPGQWTRQTLERIDRGHYSTTFLKRNNTGMFFFNIIQGVLTNFLKYQNY
jgi:hypothetical protein